MTIEDALARLPEKAEIVCELKVGRGDSEAALAALIELLEERAADRWWIDSFSSSLLRRARLLCPGASLSLHSERVDRKGVWTGAPQEFRVTRIPYQELKWIDAISVRWWGAESRVTKSIDEVRAHKFVPILSRLNNASRIVAWSQTPAWGGYVDADLDEAMVSALADAAAVAIKQ